MSGWTIYEKSVVKYVKEGKKSKEKRERLIFEGT